MIRESQQTTIPPEQLAEASAAVAAAREKREAQFDEPTEPKHIPPVWVLIAAAVLSAVVYYVVLKLRGVM